MNRGQDTAKYSTAHRMSLLLPPCTSPTKNTMKNYLAPNVNSAEVDKSCLKATGYGFLKNKLLLCFLDFLSSFIVKVYFSGYLFQPLCIYYQVKWRIK